MNRLFLTMCLAIALPLTIYAYDYVDSLTVFSSIGQDRPMLDIYGDTISLNTDYYAADADNADLVVHVGYSGDTLVAMYLSRQDTTNMVKLERFLSNAQGQLYMAGILHSSATMSSAGGLSFENCEPHGFLERNAMSVFLRAECNEANFCKAVVRLVKSDELDE